MYEKGDVMRKTLLERFEDKYIPVSETGCWIWIGCYTCATGYGRIKIDGKHTLSHRASYEMYIGPIPKNLHCLHSCDTPECVNPDHLFLGTHQDNMADRDAKGRGNAPNGEKCGASKLTESQALEIFHAKGTNQEIADHYGITSANVGYIKRKVTWKHIHLKKTGKAYS